MSNPSNDQEDKFGVKNVWFWIFVIMLAGWAFACTRGRDGELWWTLSFPVIGLLYGIALCGYRTLTIETVLAHSLVMEAAAAAAMAIDAQLDEMAGMLYFLVPILVMVMVGEGLAVYLAVKAVK